jgi:hypothetical protein
MYYFNENENDEESTNLTRLSRLWMRYLEHIMTMRENAGFSAPRQLRRCAGSNGGAGTLGYPLVPVAQSIDDYYQTNWNAAIATCLYGSSNFELPR